MATSGQTLDLCFNLLWFKYKQLQTVSSLKLTGTNERLQRQNEKKQQ